MSTTATVDTDGEAASGRDQATRSRRPSRELRIPISASALSLVTFVVIAALLVAYIAAKSSDIGGANSDSGDRAAVVSAAKREFTGITTINKSTPAATVSALKAGVTADFRTSVSQDITQLQQYATTTKVSVASAGVQSISKDQATVLLATTGSVTTSASKNPSSISSSIKVTLSKVSGTWLVAAMDLVQ